MKRANWLIAVGAILLVVGIALIWILGRDDRSDPEPLVAVLVASTDLQAGEAGSDIVANGRVDVRQIRASELTPGALRSADAMSGSILSISVAKDQQIEQSALRTTSLKRGSIKIPDGKQAIALTVDFTAGVAGYVGPGDHVNIYLNIAPNTPGAPRQPFTKLLLSDIEVLDVDTELRPQRAEPTADGAAPTRAAAKDITVLVALDAQQAEAAIFATRQNELWMTLLPEDQGPSSTDGVDYRSNYAERAGQTGQEP